MNMQNNSLVSREYKIEDDCILVEDDGQGMSYETGDIEKYLNVAAETRTSEDESFVGGMTRKKMGRKGVGKLAALSVSENVHIYTKKNQEKSGFILSRNISSCLVPHSDGQDF